MSRVVLITGGGSGIGKACAALFRENGDTVFIQGRNEEKLQKTGAELGVSYVQGDISDVAQCDRAISQVIAQTGRLDVLVNCAGVSVAGPSENMTEQDWDKVVGINLKGTFFMIKYAIPYLKQSHGSIVNISSDAGVVGNTELAIYCASKGGVTVMTKALALEMARFGVRVNSVCPTETDTDMLEQDIIEYGYGTREAYQQSLMKVYPQKELARFVKPEEVAEAVFFLADNRKAAAITGTELMVDFGITAGYEA